MADGESPKARPKRVKPDRPRPTTSSFRPTGGGSPRSGGPRPGSGPRTGGSGPRLSGFRPDQRIPRGPDERPSGERPSFERPSFDRPSFDRPAFNRPGGRPRDEGPGFGRPRDDRPRDDRPRDDRAGGRPWPGRPQGDRPRLDGPRQARPGFGFRGRPEGQDRPDVRDQTRRPRFERPGGFPDRPRFEPGEPPADRARPERPPFERTFRPSGGRPFGAERDRPDRDRPPAPRPFGNRPGRPSFDRGRPDFARPTSFNRPGLEPAEAGLVEAGDEIVAGRRPVEEAFVARREARRLLVVPQRRDALEKLVLHATSLRIPIVEVEGGSMTALTGFDGHQGIALVVAPRRYASVTDILARAIERGEPPFVLILDSLEDPQNVGTLLRSAEAAGAHGVIFPTRRQAPLSPAAVKASAGAVEHLLLAPVDDLAGALADLHVSGLRVVGAEAEAPLTIREADLRGPIALVVGSEGQGLGPAVRKRCDLMVRIPMRGAIGSLNASVAGSILLFEAATQRGDVPTKKAPKSKAPPADGPSLVEAQAAPVVPSLAEAQAAPVVELPEAQVPAGAEPQAEAQQAPVDTEVTEVASEPAKRAKPAKAGATPEAEPKPKAEAKPKDGPKPKAAKVAKPEKAAKAVAKATRAEAKTQAKASTRTRKKAETDPTVVDTDPDLLP